MQKIREISAAERIPERSLGTTFFMVLSLEPSMVQEAITSQRAMRCFNRNIFFSSMEPGTGSSRTPASTFQKRFWG